MVMLFEMQCKHLVCGKICAKLEAKCLEKRFFGGVEHCKIRENKTCSRPSSPMPHCKPAKSNKPDLDVDAPEL